MRRDDDTILKKIMWMIHLLANIIPVNWKSWAGISSFQKIFRYNFRSPYIICVEPTLSDYCIPV